MPASRTPKPSSRKADPVSRIVFVVQETGGVGKSTISRALAEAVVDVPVYEIESSHRLLELGDRVRHFPIRASSPEKYRTGGEASLVEFNPAINALLRESAPAIVDVGANGAEALLSAVGRVAPAFARRGKELGIVAVAAAPDSALESVEALFAMSKAWATIRFVVANEYRGEVDKSRLNGIAAGATITSLPRFGFAKGIVAAIEPLGLAGIPSIDDEELARRLPDEQGQPDEALAAMALETLAEFRLAAMQAVRSAAEWLVGG